MPLHQQQSYIVFTEDTNIERVATRINEAISQKENLPVKLIRITKPPA